ncbi:uncharacterized protein LOC143803877 [Ranitomeya variabilis]|uniref:uncharacterized protein LOC143803877 n=1 Tax=Ranitomeya variabilis TaxID=490064 RepID=UPI0040578ED4
MHSSAPSSLGRGREQTDDYLRRATRDHFRIPDAIRTRTHGTTAAFQTPPGLGPRNHCRFADVSIKHPTSSISMCIVDYKGVFTCTATRDHCRIPDAVRTRTHGTTAAFQTPPGLGPRNHCRFADVSIKDPTASISMCVVDYKGVFTCTATRDHCRIPDAVRTRTHGTTAAFQTPPGLGPRNHCRFADVSIKDPTASISMCVVDYKGVFTCTATRDHCRQTVQKYQCLLLRALLHCDSELRKLKQPRDSQKETRGVEKDKERVHRVLLHIKILPAAPGADVIVAAVADRVLPTRTGMTAWG